MRKILLTFAVSSFVAGFFAAFWPAAGFVFAALGSLALWDFLRSRERHAIVHPAAASPIRFHVWCAGLESVDKIIEMFDDIMIEPDEPTLDVRFLVTSKFPDVLPAAAEELQRRRPELREKTHFVACDLFGAHPWPMQTRFDFIKLHPEYGGIAAAELSRVKLGLELSLSGHGMMTGVLVSPMPPKSVTPGKLFSPESHGQA